jgi:hypothetical protein
MDSGMFLAPGREMTDLLVPGGLESKFPSYLECMGTSFPTSSLDIMVSLLY